MMYTPTDGSPKTLKQAIQNGLCGIAEALRTNAKVDPSEILLAHVRDFLAQKFAAVMLDDPKIETLWNKVVRKDAA